MIFEVDWMDLLGILYNIFSKFSSPNAGINYGYTGMMAHIMYETQIPFYINVIFNPLTMIMLCIVLELWEESKLGGRYEEEKDIIWGKTSGTFFVCVWRIHDYVHCDKTVLRKKVVLPDDLSRILFWKHSAVVDLFH